MINDKKPVIAVDGFSSTGKSSISKIIANKLDIIHIDTGALYRGVTLFAIENCLKNKILNNNCLTENLEKINLKFKNVNGELSIYLNGRNIDLEIRNPEVSNLVSEVSSLPEVRSFLLSSQRQMARNGGVIMDGRDIGSVVLPNADYKFFLTASLEERSLRRYKELLETNNKQSFEDVKNNLSKRDKIDSQRSIAPLKQAPDAILIDNTNINREQTADLILSYIIN